MRSFEEAYVISDLHLGGDPAGLGVPGGRGFRMCTQGEHLARFIRALARRPADARTELVIAGDFVDFLAERTPDGAWSSFRRDPDEARRVLDLIALEREPAVFAALRDLLAAGHRLTILLGNHDTELALPGVRQRLAELLGAEDGAPLRFLYDNESYTFGDVLIEHGNRVDVMNEVDHDGLRRIRVLQSRRDDDPRELAFTPPVGSRIVAELMNPLKERMPFIDCPIPAPPPA